MLVGVDANISPKVMRALQSLYPSHDFVRVGVGPANSDAPWISAFADAGGEALLTLDKRILSRPHEVEALHGSGLLTCVFDFGKMTDFRMQASAILEYWQYLEPVWADRTAPKVLRARPSRSRAKPTIERLEFYIAGGRPKVRAVRI